MNEFPCVCCGKLVALPDGPQSEGAKTEGTVCLDCGAKSVASVIGVNGDGLLSVLKHLGARYVDDEVQKERLEQESAQHMARFVAERQVDPLTAWAIRNEGALERHPNAHAAIDPHEDGFVIVETDSATFRGKLMKLDPVRRSELYVLHTSTLVGD